MTKLASVRKLLQTSHLDAFLLSSESDIRYLTNYSGFSQHERDAFILVTSRNAYLFTSPLYSHEIALLNLPVVVKEMNATHKLTDYLSNICSKESINKIGFDETDLTVAEFDRLTKVEHCTFIPTPFWNLRLYKTDEEIQLLQKACRITDQAYEHILNHVEPGMTEKDVAGTLEIIIRQHGGELSFPTIVAFGKNAAVPHHQTTTTKLKKNDLILIDFGVRYHNYCSDMTRTFFIGKSTRVQQQLFDIVIAAQQHAINYIEKQLTSGNDIKAADVDRAARDYIVKQGYPPFPHSLGHGIGIEVHEAPLLSPRSDELLTNGMVFSIEPGIYLPDKIGVRIEDIYAIKKNKLIRLTHSTT